MGVGGSRLSSFFLFVHLKRDAWLGEMVAHQQIRSWCMPRAALSCAYAGKRPSVRTEAPDEAKPRPSAQQVQRLGKQHAPDARDLQRPPDCGRAKGDFRRKRLTLTSPLRGPADTGRLSRGGKKSFFRTSRTSAHTRPPCGVHGLPLEIQDSQRDGEILGNSGLGKF